MTYVPLHVHSINSPYHGMMTPEEIVSRASYHHLPAVALTDRWTSYGHFEFSEAAKIAGIKPVFGAEIRHLSLTGADGLFHLTVLAENNDGYGNLAKLISLHYGKEKDPHVTEEEMAECSEGLIVLTGCLKGEANQAVLRGNLGRERAVVEKLLEIYGREQVYLELMTHNVDVEQLAMDKMILLSEKLKVPMVVTNNDRYQKKEDEVYFTILRQLAGDSEADTEGNGEFYLKKRKELEPLFYPIVDALDESGRIAERCNVTIDINGKIAFPAEETAGETLSEMCNRRFLLEFHSLKPDDMSKIKRNLKTEIDSVLREGMAGFLLYIRRLFQVCESQGIWLEIMGSDILESFIVYLLGINPLNPMNHGLVFESFNSFRPGVPPPLELIKSKGTRDRFLEILRAILPENKVFNQVIREEASFLTIAKELCEVLGAEQDLQDEILRNLSTMKKKTGLASMLESSESLTHLYTGSKLARKILHSSHALQGRINHFILNSSKLVVLPKEIEKSVAFMTGNGGDRYILADNTAVMNLGGFMLGVQHSHFLSALAGSVSAVVKSDKAGSKAVENVKGEEGRWGGRSLDDACTFELISSGDTAGVYLLESRGIRDLLTKIKPETFDELVNVISLYRPGPLEGKLWQKYIENMEKKGKVYLPHHSMAAPLENTRGILLFREQVREILKSSAGLKGNEALFVERTLETERSGDLLRSRLEFIRGAMDNDINEEDAQKIFDYLLHNIKYTHNRALSCSQAYISYRTAFMKAHYSDYYFASLLNSTRDIRDRQEKYYDYLASINHPVLDADINASSREYARTEAGVRQPIDEGGILNANEIDTLLSERSENGDFVSITDFLERMSGHLAMDSVGQLIDAGLFDYTMIKRAELRDRCLEFYEKNAKAGEFFRPKQDQAGTRKKKGSSPQLSFFTDDTDNGSQ